MQKSTLIMVNSRIKYFIYECISKQLGEPNNSITWKKIRRQLRYELLKSMPYLLSKHIIIQCNKKLNSDSTINKNECFCRVQIPRFNIDITLGVGPTNHMIQRTFP